MSILPIRRRDNTVRKLIKGIDTLEKIIYELRAEIKELNHQVIQQHYIIIKQESYINDLVQRVDNVTRVLNEQKQVYFDTNRRLITNEITFNEQIKKLVESGVNRDK